MVDESSGTVPPGILEMLKIFLAASSRGDQAVLILETRNRTLTTKYRCVEPMSGAPACPSTSISNKEVNNARARRSKLRLEKFMKRKIAEKDIVSGVQLGSPADQDVGVSSNNQNQLIVSLEMAEDRPVETRLNNPIPQADGGDMEELYKEDLYSFHSEYGEEDILDSLEEIFPPKKLATLVSRDRVLPLSGSPDHLCTVMLRQIQGKKTTWPVLGPKYVDLFKDIKKIK